MEIEQVEPSAESRLMAKILFDRYSAFLNAGFDAGDAFDLTAILMMEAIDYE